MRNSLVEFQHDTFARYPSDIYIGSYDRLFSSLYSFGSYSSLYMYATLESLPQN